MTNEIPIKTFKDGRLHRFSSCGGLHAGMTVWFDIGDGHQQGTVESIDGELIVRDGPRVCVLEYVPDEGWATEGPR